MKQLKIKTLIKPFLPLFLLISISGCSDNNTVTVNFDTVGGTPVNSQTLEFGSLIEEPTGVEKDGYVLDGRFYEGIEWDFDTPVKESMTLVANWVSDTSVVNFLLNGGSMTVPSQTYRFGENVKLPIPTRNGYVFTGWYYGEELVTDGNWTILGNVTLRASWAKEKITLTYLDELKVIGTQIVGYNKPYELFKYSRDAVDVVSWSYDDKNIPLSGSSWNYSVDDIRLTPVWESIEYNLSVKGMTKDEYSCQEKVTINIGKINKLPIPNVFNSNDCGDFQGWFLDGERVSDNKGIVSQNRFPKNNKNELEAIFGYPINSASDFENIRNNLGGFYYLNNDIDLGGRERTPIGTIDEPFTGAIFGFGHTIQNFKITKPTTHAALFAFCEGATFNDIKINNAVLEYLTPLGQESYCSAICALGNYCEYENIIILGNNIFNVISRSSNLCISSVAYSNESVFTYCVNLSNIKEGEMVGGIGLSTSWNNTYFINCINFGDLFSIGDAFGIGRGENDNGSIFLNCVNYGDLIAEDKAYGIGSHYCQYFYPGFKNCVNFGNISGYESYGIGSGYQAYFDNSIEEDSPFFYNCGNYGKISGKEIAIGIGSLLCNINGTKKIYVGFEKCVNKGEISAYVDSGNCKSYGIGQYLDFSGSSNRFLYFKNCLNIGNVYATEEDDWSSYSEQSFGLGRGTHFEHCMNFGDLYGKFCSAIESAHIASLQSVLLVCHLTGNLEIGPLVDSKVEYYDCFDSYYYYTTDETYGEIVNEKIGIAISEITSINRNFLKNEMGFNESVWNLSEVNLEKGNYPALKGKPFEDFESMKNITTYNSIFNILNSWN